jgi:TRAP-type mannitol/chloroaromatic compound transport system substrate-binding protein
VARIFLSYRRQDSDIWVARLAESLRREFGHQQVFQDVTGIAPGADFVEVLDKALAGAAVTLVVIGPGWLSATDKQGRRRVDQPGDFVRLEVAESLRRLRVFPVLVNGAEMPTEDDLPEPLKPLARRHAVELTVRHWDNDVADLLRHLKQVPGLAEVAAPQEAAAPSPGPAPVDGSSDRPASDRLAEGEGRVSAPRPRLGLMSLAVGIAVAVLAGTSVYLKTRDDGQPPPPVARTPERVEPPTKGVEAPPQPSPRREASPARAATNLAYTGPPVALKVQDTFTRGFGYSSGLRDLAATLDTNSGGRIKLEILPAGAVVSSAQAIDAVAKGTLDAVWGFPGTYAAKEAALALVDAPPFGPALEQYLPWRRRPDVAAIVDEVYRPLAVHGIPCGVVWLADLWSKAPIPTASALKGRKIRSVGLLRAEIFARAGAAQVSLPGGEVFPALERGLIDAVQFLDPESGVALGFSDMSRILYFPARLTPAAGIDLIVNQAKWTELGAAGKRLLDQACDRNGREMLETGRAQQQAAVAKIALKGVAVEELPADVLNALRTAWRSVAAERRKDPNFAKLYDSLREFDAGGR